MGRHKKKDTAATDAAPALGEATLKKRVLELSDDDDAPVTLKVNSKFAKEFHKIAEMKRRTLSLFQDLCAQPNSPSPSPSPRLALALALALSRLLFLASLNSAPHISLPFVAPIFTSSSHRLTPLTRLVSSRREVRRLGRQRRQCAE